MVDIFEHASDNERIICAAIHCKNGMKSESFGPANIYSGIVISGLRHNDCISIVIALSLENPTQIEIVQGFITNKNRFVDRYEAYEIAKREKQLHPKYENFKGDEAILFSEDLY